MAEGGVSDGVVQICVHMLELALHWWPLESAEGEEEQPGSEQGCCGQASVLDLHLLIWFPGSDLLANLAHRITRVLAFDSIPAQSEAFATSGLDCPEMPELRRLNAVPGQPAGAPSSRVVARKAGIPYIDSLDATAAATASSPPRTSQRAFWDSYWAALPAPIRRLYIAHMYKPPLSICPSPGDGNEENDDEEEASSSALALQPTQPVQIVEVSSEESESEQLQLCLSSTSMTHSPHSSLSSDPTPSSAATAISWEGERPPLLTARPPPKALPSPGFYPTDLARQSLLSLLVSLYPKYNADGRLYTPEPEKGFIFLRRIPSLSLR